MFKDRIRRQYQHLYEESEEPDKALSEEGFDDEDVLMKDDKPESDGEAGYQAPANDNVDEQPKVEENAPEEKAPEEKALEEESAEDDIF